MIVVSSAASCVLYFHKTEIPARFTARPGSAWWQREPARAVSSGYSPATSLGSSTSGVDGSVLALRLIGVDLTDRDEQSRRKWRRCRRVPLISGRSGLVAIADITALSFTLLRHGECITQPRCFTGDCPGYHLRRRTADDAAACCRPPPDYFSTGARSAAVFASSPLELAAGNRAARGRPASVLQSPAPLRQAHRVGERA